MATRPASPRVTTARRERPHTRSAWRTTAIALCIPLSGCTPGAAVDLQPPGPAVAHASLDAAVVLSERATKAKVAAASFKEEETLQSIAPSAQEQPGAGRCPPEMALVGGRVCVDRWEASLLEQTYGGERPWSPFATIDGQERRMRAVSRPGVIPQGYISGKQARTACTASGKRLCTSDEWLSACEGPDETTFPYGPTRQRGVCNDDVRHVHPVAEIALLLDIKPGEIWTKAMNSPLINQLSQSLLPTGERSGCTNAYGVFDMVGNLHEWVDDRNGTFRGGYYMDTTLNGDGCKYATKAHDFTYHDYSTGFRCCMDPEQVD